MGQGYFEKALQDFVSDFGYGGAIRHMLNRGYTVDQIVKSGEVKLSRERIEEIAEKHLKEMNNKGAKG